MAELTVLDEKLAEVLGLAQAAQALHQRIGSRLSAPTGADAMHRAPIVDSGETSTRWEPMFIDIAIPIGSAPPRRSARPGTIGRKAGRTTPDVLL